MLFKKQDIAFLNALLGTVPANAKYKNEMRQVIELFTERHIETRREAAKTIELLKSQGKKVI
jgi:hypothetical protein